MAEIPINGFRCHYDYREHLPGAPTVVFFNGIMSMLESWDRQLPLLERLGYNCLRFEYRGQWRSELTPWPYSFDLHCRDLAALMDAVGIERAHLVGTSYGGFVNMRFAELYPERSLSLAILTSSAQIGPLSRRIVGNWCELAAAGDLAGMYRAVIPELYDQRFIESHADQIDTRLAGIRQAMEAAPHFLEGQVALHETSFVELSGEGALGRLAAIRCPTLVVAAANDRVYPPACSEQIARRIAGSRYLLVPNTGHALVVERPEVVNLLLAGLLTETA